MSADERILGGAICFVGTRVPLELLLDWLGAGDSVEEFVRNFPTVTRDQALAVVAWQQTATRRSIGLEEAS